jgi:hypothetical protein
VRDTRTTARRLVTSFQVKSMRGEIVARTYLRDSNLCSASYPRVRFADEADADDTKRPERLLAARFEMVSPAHWASSFLQPDISIKLQLNEASVDR